MRSMGAFVCGVYGALQEPPYTSKNFVEFSTGYQQLQNAKDSLQWMSYSNSTKFMDVTLEGTLVGVDPRGFTSDSGEDVKYYANYLKFAGQHSVATITSKADYSALENKQVEIVLQLGKTKESGKYFYVSIKELIEL